MDESGINSNESYPYGWSKKGERYYDSKPGKNRERLSIIGAGSQTRFFAPLVYQGYCSAQLIEFWLQKLLLPQLQPGQVIVMDNAPFHKSRKIRELIEEAGCELLFLPTYSPDFNPIEHWWHKVKTAIRKKLPLYNFDVNKAASAAFQSL